MADPVKSALNNFARVVLSINGFNGAGKPPAKPKPKPKVKPPAKGSITPVGQTNLFNAKGNPRDFRNPQVAANRPPTNTPVSTRSNATATPPNRPAGGFGQAPGQGSLFGRTPNAKPNGNFRAPNIPAAGTGGFRPTAQALEWFKQQGTGAATNRALANARGLQIGNALNGLAMLATTVDQAKKVFNPKDNLLTSLGDLGNTLSNGGRPGPGHSRYQAPQPQSTGPIGPQQTPGMVNNYYQERNARHDALRADLNAQPPLRRSPAAGAPIHATPQQFGSVYAPQANAPVKPNAPVAAAKTADNPFAGIGDVRGQQMGQGPAADSTFKAGDQQYGGQALPGIDQNGMDLERRRAFLDADNSLDGMKAVRELLKRRKLSISFSD